MIIKIVYFIFIVGFFPGGAQAIKIDAPSAKSEVPLVFADDRQQRSDSWTQSFCTWLLSRFPRTKKTDKKYARAVRSKLDKSNTYLTHKASAYLLSESEFKWDWQISEGRVRINILDNSQYFNGILLDLAGILALLTDGYVGDNQWQRKYAMNFPNPVFRVAVHMRSDALRSVAALGPYQNSLVVGAAMTAVDGPIGEPTVQMFKNAKTFYDYSARVADLMVNSSFAWVEIQWTPSQLANLKSRLKQSLNSSRP